MRKVAVFDFDGTLTTKDTLLEFIRFACGSRQFYWGFLRFSPLLVMMKFRLYPNWRVKQKIFSYFFKGWDYGMFQNKGRCFAEKIDMFRREEIIAMLKEHVANGDTVYVISASMEDWVKPWCESLGVKAVMGTRIEVVDGIITGKFLSKNCYGREKVNRLQHIEPCRTDYYLYAYGDSNGDKELIAYADEGKYV